MRLPKTITVASFIFMLGGCAACVQTVYHVRVHRYFEYGMFRLAADSLRTSVNEWLLISLAGCAVVLFLSGCAIVLSRALVVHMRSPRIVKIFGTVILCFGIALLCWSMDNFIFEQLSFRFRWRVVLTALIFGCCLVPGMLFLWRDWRPVLPARIAGLVLASGCFFVFSGAVLNGFLYIDQKKASNAQKPNVVLIVIDCLRARDLGCYGSALNASPAIDRLADQGVVFEKAYSNAPWTKPSVSSIFTSQYPGTHKAVAYSDALSSRWLTIAEILKNNAYHTCFFNGGNYNFARPFNFQQGFDYFDFEFTKKDAEILTDEFLSHIAKSDGRPFFAHVHYMDAHQPYYKKENTDAFVSENNILFDPISQATDIELMAFFGIVRKLEWAGKLSAEDHRYLKGLYNSQIWFIDKNIQKIVAFLKRERLYDDTIIIITSDHGEEFWEHQNYEHGHSLYNELLHVPLIVAGGRIQHKVVQKSVQLISLMPTVLDLLRIGLPDGYCQGVSLRNTILDGDVVPEMPVYASGTKYGDEKFCIIGDNKKVIFNTGNTTDKNPLIGYASAERFEYYNLLDDPLEQEPLKEGADGKFAILQEMLLRFSKAASPDATQQAIVDEALRKKLESIGYVQ